LPNGSELERLLCCHADTLIESRVNFEPSSVAVYGSIPVRLIPTDVDQRKEISVEEADADCFSEPVRSRRGRIYRKPFRNADWEAMKQKIQPGDRLYAYCTSKQSWRICMGSEGIELVRDGQIIDCILLRMN
jgi:hypothetical protein